MQQALSSPEKSSPPVMEPRTCALPGAFVKREEDGPRVLGERYRVGPLIGRGRFGVVRLGSDLARGGRHVALKCVTPGVEQRVLDNEISVLRHLMRAQREDPSLCQSSSVPLDLIEDGDSHVVVLEYLWGGDLFDRIMLKGYVEESVLQPIVRSLVGAICKLHDHSVLHRDIKPENVLFRVQAPPSTDEHPLPEDKNHIEDWANLEPVLCDFGLSHVLGKPDLIEAPAGTFGYASPQMLSLERTNSRACDVWSLGVLMFASLAGELPFPASTDGKTSLEDHLAEAYRGPRFLNPRWNDVSEDAKSLISEMLHYSPYNRIPMHQLSQHPWLQR